MDCRHFENALDDLCQGRLAAGQRQACERHAATCAACGELLALASLAAGGESAPPELAASVLAQTSGAPCERATRSLPELVDRALSAEERELVAAHVESCAACSALAAALAALARELPRLSEVAPDPGFVDQVLRRTLPVDIQLRRWWARTWPRWLRRPRFASEAAYVCLLVLVLVFATPGSPLEAVPQRALAVAQQPVRAEGGFGDALRSRAAATRTLVGSSGSRALESWTAAGSQVAGRAKTLAGEVGGDLATLWQEAASLLGNEGDDAARETSHSTEENP